MVDAARERALELLAEAEIALSAVVDDESPRDLSRVAELREAAEGALRRGDARLAGGDKQAMENLSAALRGFTACQVRAKQVITELR